MKQLMMKERGRRAVAILLGLAVSGSLLAATSVSTGTVRGRAPVAAPTVDNTAPILGDTVTATSGFSDADGDAEQGTTWRWLLDGNPIAGALSNAYTLATGDNNGRQLVVEATPATDPASTAPAVGAPVRSTAITTQGAAPVATVGAIATQAYQYDLMTSGSYAYSDADGDAESGSTFNWLLGGTSIGSGSIAGGAVNKSRQLLPADVGKSLTFSITPKSATGVPNTGVPTPSPAVTVTVPAGLQVSNFFTPENSLRTWNTANAYCTGLGGRLPSQNELQQLFVNATRSTAFAPNAGYSTNGEMCSLHGWPLIVAACNGSISNLYWTSTPNPSGTPSTGGYRIVDMRQGIAYDGDLNAVAGTGGSSGYHAACVR